MAGSSKEAEDTRAPLKAAAEVDGSDLAEEEASSRRVKRRTKGGKGGGGCVAVGSLRKGVAAKTEEDGKLDQRSWGREFLADVQREEGEGSGEEEVGEEGSSLSEGRARTKGVSIRERLEDRRGSREVTVLIPISVVLLLGRDLHSKKEEEEEDLDPLLLLEVDSTKPTPPPPPSPSGTVLEPHLSTLSFPPGSSSPSPDRSRFRLPSAKEEDETSPTRREEELCRAS